MFPILLGALLLGSPAVADDLYQWDPDKRECRNSKGRGFNRDKDYVGQCAEWVKVDKSKADFSEKDLRGSTINLSNLKGAIFHDAQLDGVYFNETDLSGASLKYAEARFTSWFKVTAIKADFTGATLLPGIFVQDSNFDNAVFSKAKMSGFRTLKSSFQGAKFSKDFNGGLLEQSNFKKASFDGAGMWGVTVHNSDFSGASFVASNINGAFFNGSIFREVNMDRAILTNSSAIGADFRAATLTNMTVSNLKLERADLRGSDLSNPKIIQGEIVLENTLFDDKTVPYSKDIAASEKEGMIYVKGTAP